MWVKMRVYFTLGLHLFEPDADQGGLRFHRWLPNGEQDAIGLKGRLPVRKLKVWVPRRGFVRDSFIEFDSHRQEVDERIIPRQGMLTAGPLLGSFESTATPRIVRVLKRGAVGDPDYVAFAKKIVDSLHPAIGGFLDTLRVQYGQYWVRSLRPWDSTKTSLGGYTRALSLRWSLDRANWTTFEPNQAIITVTANLSTGGYQQLLTEEDWRRLQSVASRPRSLAAAALLVTSARRLLEEGSIAHALVEAVTALEVATDEVVKQARDGREYADSVQAFLSLKNPSKVAVCLALRTNLSAEKLRLISHALRARNRFVHEGRSPTTSDASSIVALIDAVAALLPGEVRKRPTRNMGNHLSDNWPAGGSRSPRLRRRS
jgi:hypothetical protein